MKKIKCNNYEFEQIKNNLQTYKIFSENNFKFLEQLYLVNENNEELLIQITGKYTYDSLQDMLKIIELNNFGKYKNDTVFFEKMKELYSSTNNINVCRIKNIENNSIEIDDLALTKLIDMNNIERLTLGLSGCDVFKTITNDKQEAILKIKKISKFDCLKEEAEVLDFLSNKVNVAKNIYYNQCNNKEYLLRECIEGKPLYMEHGFGKKLGEELKKMHMLYDPSIKFDKFSTDNILKNMLSKIDGIYTQRGEKFKSYTKEELIEFLINNKPEDDSLIHGDFSLTNILNNNGKYYYIDLSGVSKSTKYFDIYVLKKSLEINNLVEEFNDFLEGYGIKKINDNYMDWMRFVELSY